MFYIEIKRPIYRKGEEQELGYEIEQKFGVKPGIHLVKNGKVRGSKGEAPYWEYINLLKSLPTLRTRWDDSLASTTDGDREFIAIDLFTKEGLLLEEAVTVQLHVINQLSDKEEGKYLLLCSREDVLIQIVAM